MLNLLLLVNEPKFDIEPSLAGFFGYVLLFGVPTLIYSIIRCHTTEYHGNISISELKKHFSDNSKALEILERQEEFEKRRFKWLGIFLVFVLFYIASFILSSITSVFNLLMFFGIISLIFFVYAGENSTFINEKINN